MPNRILMRYFMFCSLLLPCLWATTTYAQDSTRYVSGGDLHVSGAGGLLVQAGAVAAHDGIHAQVGGGGGLLLGKRLLIGAYGMGIASYAEHRFHTDTADWKAKLEMDHSGVLLQYAFTPIEPVHPFVGLQIGWGRARWNFTDDDDDDDNGNGPSDAPPDLNDRVFVLTPSAGVQVNITRWFRPDIYLGWRIVDGLNLDGLGSADLNGFFFGVNATFGGLGD